jgi:hypothetical protein
MHDTTLPPTSGEDSATKIHSAHQRRKRSLNGAAPFNEAIDFLERLRPGGPWQLTAIDPDDEKKITTTTIRSVEQARAFVEKYNGKRNIYYALNPVRIENCKASKTDVSAIEYVHNDLDPKDDETTEAAKARYLEALKLFQPAVGFVVDSGNGLNGAWKLNPPIILPKPLRGEEDGKPCWVLSPRAERVIADVEARAKAMMEKLGSVAGTQNIDRILRLPGTTNLPNKAKRDKGRVKCQAKLVSFSAATCRRKQLPPGVVAKNKSADSKTSGASVVIDWGKVEEHKGWLKGVGDLPAGFNAKGRMIVRHKGKLLTDLNDELKEAGLMQREANGQAYAYKSWSDVTLALAAIFKADGRFSTEQIAAALMCGLDCNHHILKSNDQKVQRRAVARAIQNSFNPPLQARAGDPDWRERYINGMPRASLENARLAIEALGIVCSYDTFHERMLFGRKDDGVQHELQQFIGDVTDNGIMALRNLLSQKFGFDLKENNVRDAVISLALEHCFDPVVDMLAEAEAKWDGVKRLDRMAVDYFNTEDTPLNRAFVRKAMIAGVARPRNPGCKKDEMLTDGEQGGLE